MKGLSYEALRHQYGKAWADRVVACRDNGMPEFPDGDVFERSCPTCAGYGMPGWVVVDRSRWERCGNCNYEGVNNTGRNIYKYAWQTHRVNGGVWMPREKPEQVAV